MSEKRGYPNPNYTEDDIMPGIPMEVKTELIMDDQLIEYIQKAAMFDCLAATVKAMGKVDDDVVRALTGTFDPKEHEDIVMYRSWYNDEKSKNEKLREKVATLERARTDLIEILRQNKIGEFADEAKEDQEEAPADE